MITTVPMIMMVGKLLILKSRSILIQHSKDTLVITIKMYRANRKLS